METVCEGQLCMTNVDSTSEKLNELAFKKGDLILVLSSVSEDEGNWLGSAADGTIGHFPLSAVAHRASIPMLPMPWFHSGISRLEAEKLLDRNQDGQFLLRTSQSTKAVYALAVSCQGAIQHYLVAMDFKTRQVTLNGDTRFSNLPSLVQHYKRQSGDLCCLLRVPVVRRGVLEFYIDQEELKKNWGLPSSELTDLNDDTETLGEGEFGQVRVANYRGTQVAVKFIHSSKQSAAAVTSFLKEATIFTHLRHQNLVQLVGVVFQGPTIQSIVMELMAKGSLQKYLISRGRAVVSQPELLSFARDVCEGMVYISSMGYVHRDLAARNVLLNRNGQAKISDFGLLRKADIHVPHEGGKFPVKWTAPEALKESRFSVKSDVWSFGVLLWEVFSYGRTPYPSIPTDEVLEMLEDGIVMDPPDNCPDSMYSIMCSCWKTEPSDRPSFSKIRQSLAKSAGDPHSPFASPMVPRKSLAPPDFNVDELVNSPQADQSYQEAPQKRKVTLLLGNVLFVGPQGSGKTSLLRSLTGESFRLMEPLSSQISVEDGYHAIGSTLEWTVSTSGLMYEDELVKIIVEDLLKHAFSRPHTNSRPLPLLPTPEYTPPPLPPRRVHSFSEAHGRSTLSASTELASHRLSGSYDTISSPTHQPTTSPGYHLQPLANGEGVDSPKLGRSNRLLGKLTSSFRARGHASRNTDTRRNDVRRSNSDSCRRDQHISPAPDTPPPYVSSLPERLIEKIGTGLRESAGGPLPSRHYGKLIDTPGHPAFQSIKQLFVTDNSLCVLTLDASRDIMSVPSPSLQRKVSGSSLHGNSSTYYGSGCKYSKSSYLGQIMVEIGNICLQWSHSKSDMTLCGPRIVVVATHSDKVPSSVSHRNFELLHDAVKASPYRKYVSLLKFIVSSSSIIERSSTDDLKHFVMELIKKACRHQIPLKWLRCVRRFQGLSKQGTYFITLSEAKKTIAQICDISEKEEISRVIHFLHDNLVILHFHRLHHLKELVITDPTWFANTISLLFSASFADLSSEGAPSELSADQELLRTKGVLTSQLLGFVWRDKSSRVRMEELLAILYKMDLVCYQATETHPLPPTTSIEDLTKDKSGVKMRGTTTTMSIIVPGLVEEKKPSHLATLPSFNIEPIVFRFKTDHIPSGLFSRLLVRCIQCYPKNYSVFTNGATFEVDTSCLLMISLETDHFKVSLHKIRNPTVTSPLPSSMDVTDLDSLLNDPNTPNPDTCLAVLMFVRATLTDLVRQWMPHLDFDICVSCDCPAHLEEDVVDHHESPPLEESLSRKMSSCSTSSIRSKSPSEKHYIILNDVESLSECSIKCELGTALPSSPSLSCWFGELPSDVMVATSPTDDLGDLITDSDVNLVINVLGESWQELGQTLGFTRKELQRLSLSSGSTAKASEKMLRKWQTLHAKTATVFGLLGALEIVQRRDIADELVAARMADDGISL